MLQESGYVTTPWPALGVMALILFVLGGALFYADPQVGRDMTMRAYAVISSGIVLVAGVIAGRLFVPKRRQPA
jgi:hypothetical protein